LTIGNYLGAIQQWVEHQDEFDAYYCVVDLHAITVDFDPGTLADKSREVAGLYLACGLDPKKSTIFIQSHVKAHSELAWLLECITPLGWLNRMTQFKEKSAKQQAETVSNGLLSYPVLMAADILLYQAELVPVGDDQRQHLELTRDIAQRFNHLFGETFTIPAAMIPPSGARVMGLDEPTTKMSKSSAVENHAVHLLDPPNKIKKKIMRATTDSGRDITFNDDSTRAGVNNLLTIYQALTHESQESIESHFEGKGYGDLKKAVVEVVVESLAPIQEKYRQLTEDVSYIDGLLAEGAARAREIADKTLGQVCEHMGFLPAKSS
jgi:tryptophanyl-tRNA synthetase